VAHDYSDFEAFAVAAMPRLRRLAYAACRDHHQADDLVQGALERVFAAWPRVRRIDDPFAMHLQWRIKYVECASTVGLDASVTTNGIGGGSSVDRPRDPQTGLDAECIQRTGLPPLSPPMTDELLDGLYQRSLEQADCLKAEGYKVDPAPPREQWKADYRDGTPWFPMQRLMEAGLDVSKAMAKCPEPDPRDVAP
jgi:hypothetical protein